MLILLRKTIDMRLNASCEENPVGSKGQTGNRADMVELVDTADSKSVDLES